MFKKLKQVLCNHIYNYWGKEDLFASIGDEHRGITTPVHTFICRRCNHQIIVWDRSKNSQ